MVYINRLKSVLKNCKKEKDFENVDIFSNRLKEYIFKNRVSLEEYQLQSTPRFLSIDSRVFCLDASFFQAFQFSRPPTLIEYTTLYVLVLSGEKLDP